MTQLLSKVIFINHHKTSMRLAAAEWDAIDNICKRENIKRNTLINLISTRKNAQLGLTCSVRLFSLIYFYQLLIKNNKEKQQSTPIFDAIKGLI